jgi:hypothetical protein
MNLKADIQQNFPGSMYKVQIVDLDDVHLNSAFPAPFPPAHIHSIQSRFYSQFLWSAKLRAKLTMKKIYKADNFIPKIYEVSLDAQ